MVKRLVDIALSAALSLFFLPLLICAALLIRVTSPGPALFRQTRMGRHFQPFQIFKLRTMRQDSPGQVYTAGDDPRITLVGRFLRETKIDELPQLWNVLRGDMSLVGPRPVVPEICDQHREHYQSLLCVKPGLTDPASLKYRGETQLLRGRADRDRYFRHVVTPDKIRISAAYIQQANVWSDVRILAMTAVVCCFPSLSRLYGPLPQGQIPQRKSQRIRPAITATDGAIFSHSLAHLEAIAEHSATVAISPMIPRIHGDLAEQSASTSMQ